MTRKISLNFLHPKPNTAVWSLSGNLAIGTGVTWVFGACPVSRAITLVASVDLSPGAPRPGLLGWCGRLPAPVEWFW